MQRSPSYLLTLLLSAVAACGGSSSSETGTFAIQARWQQPAGIQQGGDACPSPPLTPIFGISGPQLPPVADTIRIILDSAGGVCCVDLTGADAAARHVVSTPVSTGNASVTLTAYYLGPPSDAVGQDTKCPTQNGVGQVCAPGQGMLTHTSAATPFEVVPGVVTVVEPQV